MVKINATQGVEFSAPATSVNASEANNVNISFNYGGNTEDVVNQATTKKSVQNTLKSNKKTFNYMNLGLVLITLHSKVMEK